MLHHSTPHTTPSHSSSQCTASSHLTPHHTTPHHSTPHHTTSNNTILHNLISRHITLQHITPQATGLSGTRKGPSDTTITGPAISGNSAYRSLVPLLSCPDSELLARCVTKWAILFSHFHFHSFLDLIFFYLI